MHKPLLFFLAAALGAGPVLAAPDGPERTNPKEELVCQEKVPVGTRLNAKRVCLTKSQWKEVRNLHRQELDRFVKDSIAIKGSAGTPR